MKISVKPFKTVGMAAIIAVVFIAVDFSGLPAYYAKNKIFQNLDSYHISKGYYAQIYYTDEDYEYMEAVKRLADTYFPVLENDFGLSGTDSINIVIYPDKYALSKGVGIDYSEKPPMGVYSGGVINILSPASWVENTNEAAIKDKFIEDGPVLHEMAHYFLDKKTKGNYQIWFSEGIALYYEYKYTGFEWRSDLEGCSDDISIIQMNSVFSQNPDDYGYRCAFEKVFNIVEKRGEASIVSIFNKLESGGKFVSVMELYS